MNANINILATMTERDEAGRHFTERYSAELLEQLETAGLIKIDRPVHEQTGIPYAQEYWHVSVTDAGIEAVADALCDPDEG